MGFSAVVEGDPVALAHADFHALRLAFFQENTGPVRLGPADSLDAGPMQGAAVSLLQRHHLDGALHQQAGRDFNGPAGGLVGLRIAGKGADLNAPAAVLGHRGLAAGACL